MNKEVKMKTKAVIFDFDGTLTKAKSGSSSWGRVWEALGDVETDNKLYEMFARGEIDDPTWMRLIEERYVELGLKKSMLDELAGKIKLISGIEKTFEHLMKNDIKIYIVSGGVKNLIETRLCGLKKFITRIEGYQFNFKNGLFCGFEPTKDCLDDKHKYVEVIKRENNILGGEILFVGNGKNDQTVFQSGARTLCINPDDADYKNTKFWNFYIEKCENLCNILEYLEKTPNSLEK